MTEVEKLYELLKKAQEPKGYYFNKDRERVNDLLSLPAAEQGTLRLYGLPLPPGLRGPPVGRRYFLPLRLPGPGCSGIRKLLLQFICQPGMERGKDSPGLRPGAKTGFQDAFLKAECL